MHLWIYLFTPVHSRVVDYALGPNSSYTWAVENKSLIVGSDNTRKTRCGWQRDANVVNGVDSSGEAKGLCYADWTEICQQFKSRLSDPDWQSNDLVSLDYLRRHCKTLCHALKSPDDCLNYSSDSMACTWLYFDSVASGNSSGVCVGRADAYMKGFAVGQIELGRDQEMYQSFIMQYDYFFRHCSQLAFRNEQTCTQRGAPCVWRPQLKESAVGGPCNADDLIILESFAPELAEFFAPETFCFQRITEGKCLTAHEEKDLSLISFIILRESIWPYYLTIFALLLSIFLMLKCCRMPPPPRTRRLSRTGLSF